MGALLAQISRNWADLVKRARAKQLSPDEFQSGTFTISNLGNFGADIFDAILPPGKEEDCAPVHNSSAGLMQCMPSVQPVALLSPLEPDKSR